MQRYRCELGIAIFPWMVTWNYAYNPLIWHFCKLFSSDETIPGSESEISGFYPSPEKNKSRLKPNPEKRNSGFKLNPEKSKADSDSDVYLTPPPPSSDEDEVSGLVNTSKDRRQQVDKPKKVVEDKDIIDVSSDSSSEDFFKEVVQPLRYKFDLNGSFPQFYPTIKKVSLFKKPYEIKN